MILKQCSVIPKQSLFLATSQMCFSKSRGRVIDKDIQPKMKGNDYIERMSQKNKDKIGSKTLLDKQWADRPMQVIKSPHKLTEVELYQTLQKIVEMPEKRLKTMINQGGTNAIDEVFLLNLAQRVPHFLTETLVNLTQVLLLQKDYFRGHPIWKPLEVELQRRKNNLDNQQLADAIYAFGVTGNATRFLFDDLEETIIESPIPIESEHMLKILSAYSLVDQGTPEFYSHVQEVILHRGLDTLTPK